MTPPSPEPSPHLMQVLEQVHCPQPRVLGRVLQKSKPLLWGPEHSPSLVRVHLPQGTARLFLREALPDYWAPLIMDTLSLSDPCPSWLLDSPSSPTPLLEGGPCPLQRVATAAVSESPPLSRSGSAPEGGRGLVQSSPLHSPQGTVQAAASNS